LLVRNETKTEMEPKKTLQKPSYYDMLQDEKFMARLKQEILGEYEIKIKSTNPSLPNKNGKNQQLKYCLSPFFGFG
jgi:hypothetical protein